MTMILCVAVERVQQREHKMDDKQLSITVLEGVTEELRDQECAVLVSDVVPALSRDYIECYFENEKRSGGGTIDEFFCSQPPDNEIVITFSSPQGSQNIQTVLQDLLYHDALS